MNIFPNVSAVLVCGVLSGCLSIWSPGEDHTGVLLKARADKVLAAIRAYRGDQGRLPADLGQLVPAYLADVTPIPGIDYEATDGSVAFRYGPLFGAPGITMCRANIDDPKWVCRGYI
jgi:hypothetical protein